MSYSSLIQVLPEAWRSSNGIAALASIGVHLIAMVALPLVEFNSPEIDSQQTIGLVELSPEELSRLPQVAPQQNPLPSASLQDELPPLPPSPAFPSDELPPLPPPTFLPPPPPLNTPPSYQSLPPQIPVAQIPLPPPPQTSGMQAPVYPSEQLPAPELSQKLERELAPPPKTVPTSPNLPSINGLKPGELLSLPANQPPPQQNNNQTQQQVAANTERGTQPPTRTALPERTKQELIARRNAIAKERLAANKTDNSNNDRNQRLAALQQRLQQPSATPNNDRTQRLAALQQRLQQPSANATPNNDRTQRLATLQRRLQQPSASNNPRPLSRATRQTIAQIDALKEVQQANPTAAIQPTIRNTIKTCNKRLDGGVAVLAAIVGPEGKIISGPNLLSKNTPVAVQQAAMTLVKGYKFPKNSQPVNQPFRLEFTYNPSICPAASK